MPRDMHHKKGQVYEFLIIFLSLDNQINIKFELVIREEQLDNESASISLDSGYAYFSRYGDVVAQ
jgi:hypothetical protein